MEKEKTYTELELRNEVKKLVKTDLTGTKVVLFVSLPILIASLALLFASDFFKDSIMIALSIAIACAIIIVLIWHLNLKAVDAEKDFCADLAKKLKNVRRWNWIYNCSTPLFCLFVLVLSSIFEFENISWHWTFIVAILVFVALFFFIWKVFESSMKQKYDGLIANLEKTE